MLADKRRDVEQVDLLEGKGFLIAGNNKEPVETQQDKKVEPAVPEEDIQIDKQKKKNKQVQKTNSGSWILYLLFDFLGRPIWKV